MSETATPDRMESFYKDQVVFLTGGTGFVGKLILQQLLDMQVKKVFLLVRKKKDQDIDERVNQLFVQHPFTSEQLKRRQNVVAVRGNITDPLLGIDKRDLQAIQEEVTVVIHSAASVRFDLSFSSAVEQNVKSVHEMLKITRKIEKLRALAHVSTAYSSCNRSFIEERVQIDSAKAEELLKTFEANPSGLDKYELQGHPNTYTLSKAYAESLVHNSGLPHIIVRPPIVVGSLQTPAPGWIDNLYTYNGVVAQAEFGLNIPLIINPTSDLNLAPVDMVANIVLAAAWRCAETPEGRGLVYNCTDSGTSPTVLQVGDKTRESLGGRLSRPKGARDLSTTSSHIVRHVCILLFFYLPAVLLDIKSWISGKEANALTQVRKSYSRTTLFDFFLTNHFTFENKNVINLARTLSDGETKKYPVDVTIINWNAYIEVIALGVGRYVEEYRKKRKV